MKHSIPLSLLVAAAAATLLAACDAPRATVEAAGADDAAPPSQSRPALPEPSSEQMTAARLARQLEKLGTEFEAQRNVLQFQFDDVRIACVFDLEHDRMRLLSPIADAEQLTDELRQVLLEANYHSALDARYATSDGILYATYIHPLSPLRPEELKSAVRQVASLVKTFGTTFSSGELLFGATEADEAETPASEPKPDPFDT